METVEMIAFVLRIASPVLALITIILCFVSMNKGKREDKALALLYNETFDKTYEVMYWENLIGRNENSDIVIEEDMTVSRTHAVLFRRNREWFISDVDSKAHGCKDDIRNFVGHHDGILCTDDGSAGLYLSERDLCIYAVFDVHCRDVRVLLRIMYGAEKT